MSDLLKNYSFKELVKSKGIRLWEIDGVYGKGAAKNLVTAYVALPENVSFPKNRTIQK